MADGGIARWSAPVGSEHDAGPAVTPCHADRQGGSTDYQYAPEHEHHEADVPAGPHHVPDRPPSIESLIGTTHNRLESLLSGNYRTGAILMILSSPALTVPRPSRLEVVKYTAPSGPTATSRMRP